MKKSNHPFVVEFRRKRAVIYPGKTGSRLINPDAPERTSQAQKPEDLTPGKLGLFSASSINVC